MTKMLIMSYQPGLMTWNHEMRQVSDVAEILLGDILSGELKGLTLDRSYFELKEIELPGTEEQADA